MRTCAVTGSGRVLRAGLLLPVLAGVLAMHVLLLCSGSGEGHSDHGATGSSVAMAPVAMGSMASMAHSVTATAAAITLEQAAAVVRDLPGTEPGGLGLAVCLAVVGAALVLGLRGRATLVPAGPVTGAGRSPGRSVTARPPPAVPLRVLLCVWRT